MVSSPHLNRGPDSVSAKRGQNSAKGPPKSSSRRFLKDSSFGVWMSLPFAHGSTILVGPEPLLS